MAAGQIPPDIQALMDKMKNGQQMPSMEDLQKIQQFSMQQMQHAMAMQASHAPQNYQQRFQMEAAQNATQGAMNATQDLYAQNANSAPTSWAQTPAPSPSFATHAPYGNVNTQVNVSQGQQPAYGAPYSIGGGNQYSIDGGANPQAISGGGSPYSFNQQTNVTPPYQQPYSPAVKNSPYPQSYMRMQQMMAGGGAGAGAGGIPPQFASLIPPHVQQMMAAAHPPQQQMGPADNPVSISSASMGSAPHPPAQAGPAAGGFNIQAMVLNALSQQQASPGHFDNAALKQQIMGQMGAHYGLSPDMMQAAASGQKPKLDGAAIGQLLAGAAGGAMPAIPVRNPNIHLQATPCEIKGHDDYIAFLRHVQAKGEATLFSSPPELPNTPFGPELVNIIKNCLSNESPKSQGNIGTLMLLNPSDTGKVQSAYALATACLSDPKNAASANSLCVALLNVGEYRHAYAVARYAEENLVGGMPQSTILSNMGFAAIGLGDFDAARTHFNAAIVAFGPQGFPQPHIGLALLDVAQAGGDWSKASIQVRLAMKRGHCAMGAAMKSAAKAAAAADAASVGDDSAATADDSSSGSSSSSGGGGWGGLNYGEISLSGGGLVLGPTAGCDYPVWETYADLKMMASCATMWGLWVAGNVPRLNEEQKKRTRLGLEQTEAIHKLVQRCMEQAEAEGGTFYPVFRDYVFRKLDEMSNDYQSQVKALWKDYQAKFTNTLKTSGVALADIEQLMFKELQQCKTEQQVYACRKKYYGQAYSLGKSTNGVMLVLYQEYFPTTARLAQNYYRESTPYIECLTPPEVQDYRHQCRKFEILTHFIGDRTILPGWPAFLSGIVGMDPDALGPPPPPSDSETAAANKDAQMEGPKKGKSDDFPPKGELSLGPAKISWDKSGFTVKASMGIVFGGSVKFSKYAASGSRETTIFGGIGASEGLGPLSAGAEGVISMTQANGRVVDVGVKGTASVGYKPPVPGIGEAKAETSVGFTARDGGSFNAGVKAKALGLGEWSEGI